MPSGGAKLTFTLSGTADISAVKDVAVETKVTQLNSTDVTGSLALANIRINPCVSAATAYVVYDIADAGKTVAITAPDGTVHFSKKLFSDGVYGIDETGTVGSNKMNLPATIDASAADHAGKIWDIKFSQVDGDPTDVCAPVPVCVNTQVELVDLRPIHPKPDHKAGEATKPNDADTDPNSPDNPETSAVDNGQQVWASSSTKGIICNEGTLTSADVFTVNKVGDPSKVTYEWKFRNLNGVTYSGTEPTTWESSSTLIGTFTNTTGVYKDIEIDVRVTYNNGAAISKEFVITRRVLPKIEVDDINLTITHVACYNEATGAIDVTTDLSSYDWEWVASAGGDLDGQTTLDLTGLKAGTYTLTVTAGKGVCGEGTSVDKVVVIKQPQLAQPITNMVEEAIDNFRYDVTVCEGQTASFELPADAANGYVFINADGTAMSPQPSDWTITKEATKWTYTRTSVTANEQFMLARVIDIDGDGDLDDCGSTITTNPSRKKTIFTVNVVVSDQALIHNPSDPSGNGKETQTICKGIAINDITYTLARGVTAKVVEPSTLPGGLTFDGSAGKLTGGATLEVGTYTVVLGVASVGPHSNPFDACSGDADGDGKTKYDTVVIHVLPNSFNDYNIANTGATDAICEMKTDEVTLFTIGQAIPNTPATVNMTIDWTPYTGGDANLNVQYVRVSDGMSTRYGTVDAATGKLVVDIRGMSANATVTAFVQATKVPATGYNFKVSGIAYGTALDNGSCGTPAPASGSEPNTALTITPLPTLE